eukprot:1114261-Rhodomonas_salina.2
MAGTDLRCAVCTRWRRQYGSGVSRPGLYSSTTGFHLLGVRRGAWVLGDSATVLIGRMHECAACVLRHRPSGVHHCVLAGAAAANSNNALPFMVAVLLSMRIKLLFTGAILCLGAATAHSSSVADCAFAGLHQQQPHNTATYGNSATYGRDAVIYGRKQLPFMEAALTCSVAGVRRRQ